MSSFISSIATIAASRSTNLTNAQPFELPSGPRIIWTSRSSPYGANMLCKSSSSIVFGSMPMNSLFSLSAWLSAIRTWRGLIACNQISNDGNKSKMNSKNNARSSFSDLHLGVLFYHVAVRLLYELTVAYSTLKRRNLEACILELWAVKSPILKYQEPTYLCEFDWSCL